VADSFWGWLEAAVVAVLWAALAFGVAAIALTIPNYTGSLVTRLDVAESLGLSDGEAIELADDVRRYTVSAQADPLPVGDGELEFSAEAVTHLDDVRAVFSAVRRITGLAAALLALWVVARVARKRWEELALGLKAGGWLVVAVVVLAIVFGLFDFTWLFARFHGVFFEPGTWQFPSDELLIGLFPLAFWSTSAAALGVLSLAGAGLLLFAGHRVARRAARRRAGTAQVA
jgi:integral membrane protein (TIGR01906 family)